jgi:hypothetical protein
MEYRVWETRSRDDLAMLVASALRERWQLQGGVSITALGDDDYLYAQAMTRSPLNIDATEGDE